MATRTTNNRVQVQVTDPGHKQSKPVSDPTRKTRPKPSTTTTSNIYNLTNNFSELNPNSKPIRTLNPLAKNSLVDTHLKVKSLSQSVNLESQRMKLGLGGHRACLGGEKGKYFKVVERKSDFDDTHLRNKGFNKPVNLESDDHRACLGGKKDKSLNLVERKSDFNDTHLRNKGFSKSVNLESQTVKVEFEGKRACLGGKKEKSLVVVERKSDSEDTHLRNKGFNKSVNLESKVEFEVKRGCLGSGKEKSLVVIDRRNDFVDTNLKVKGLSKSVNFESGSLGSRNINGSKNGVKMLMDKRRSLCDVEMELVNFMVTNSAKVVSTDMPPFMQIHAVGLARKTKDSLEKFTSKSLALSLKREFDEAYGPAWHCIVGTSFGSFVTHSVGGFLYFSLDQKWFVLFFKTTVHKAG